MQYRRLEKGEIIQAGDEIDRCADAWRDEPKWEPVHPSNIGEPAPDPQYPAHRQYRRLQKRIAFGGFEGTDLLQIAAAIVNESVESGTEYETATVCQYVLAILGKGDYPDPKLDEHWRKFVAAGKST